MVQTHTTRQAFEAAYNKDVLVDSVYPVFDQSGIVKVRKLCCWSKCLL